jgi:hypothetical protein
MISAHKKVSIQHKIVRQSVLIMIFSFASYVFENYVFADSVATSVTVGNSSPSFTAGPAENPVSDGTTPTNAGNDVTFEATATDANSEDYYLAVCITNAVTAVNGGSPTCDGGSWCISSATTSGNQATCDYTTLTGDSESNDWYAFVCDGNSTAANCSASSQGSGASGSPFKVNHAPTFNAISNNGPQNPGVNITWSTDTSTLDGDSDTVNDTVKLVVCKVAGVTNGDCTGGASDRWCQSALVANNPSCTYTLPIPTADTTYDAYAYLFDNHNMGATGANQGFNSSYAVNNAAPSVSGVSINGGMDVTLTEGTTTNVTLTATITDNNSCTDIASVEGSLYRSAITYANCDDATDNDDNNCYAEVSCSVVGAGNTCTGVTDASADYQCTVAVQYFADPTVTNTQYPLQNWLATLLAEDNNTQSSFTEVVSGVEMNTTIALDVTGSINYGTLDAGDSNDPLDKTTTVTATGNVGIDQELSGTNMTGPGTITVGYQRYALASSTAYSSATSLSATPTEVELNCSKTILSGTPATKDTWWGIEIPTGSPPGVYSGTNTVTAVLGEVGNW